MNSSAEKKPGQRKLTKGRGTVKQTAKSNPGGEISRSARDGRLVEKTSKTTTSGRLERRPSHGSFVEKDIAETLREIPAGKKGEKPVPEFNEPTDAEYEEIERAARADPDAQPVSEERLATACRDPERAARMAEKARRTRGPQIAPTKTRTTISFDPKIIEHFKKDGPGWQTRLNDFLIKALKL